MAGAQTRTQTSMDTVVNVCILCGILIAMAAGVWFFGRHWLINPAFWFRHQEIAVIDFLIEQWAFIASWLHLPVPNLTSLHEAKQFMLSTPPQEVNINAFAQVNQQVGNYVRYPVILLLLVAAALVYFWHTDTRFQNIYNLQKLKKLESQNWPQITPILSLDLLKEDLEKGPWAMARMPMDFCKEHNLLVVGEKEGKKIWQIKSNPAHSIFALQVGSGWSGVNTLPIEVKALVVIFVARALHDRDIAKRFIRQIASSANSGKLNFFGIEEQLKKYADSKPIKWLEKRHAYVNTLLASLLEIARSDGVLASADFLWLKPVNRRLWYMLNSVGRMTAVVEISGAYAHWLFEKKIGRAVKTPMVKEAVIGLEKAIEDSLYIEEGDRWHTNNAA